MPINLTDPINLLVKDPTCSLVKQIPIPLCPLEMPFMVLGWDGSGKDVDTYAGRAAACYYVMATAIPLLTSKLGRTTQWKAVPSLLVQTAAGFAINANYDRQKLNFYFAWDEVRSNMIYAASSVDVMAHELGHAFLDSLRPDLWSFAVPEIAAFHESFADIHGMFIVMQQDCVLTKTLINCEGDLAKSNLISQMGIEMGTCYFKMPIGQTKPLRDASIPFHYIDSSTLPANAPNDQLSTEAHSLSRVFTSACYALMTRFYRTMTASGADGLYALKKAGDQLMDYVIKASQVAPAGRTMFQNMVNAIAFVDHQAGGTYAAEISEVFNSWNLPVAAPIAMLSDSGPHRVEKIQKTESVKFEEMGLKTQSNDLFANVTFDVPLDEYKRYDGSDNLIEEKIPDKEATYSAIMTFVGHLRSNDRIGEGKEFRVLDSKLVRNHTHCCQGE